MDEARRNPDRLERRAAEPLSYRERVLVAALEACLGSMWFVSDMTDPLAQRAANQARAALKMAKGE